MSGAGITTRGGAILGTPAYMSPEQALGFTGDKIDARSDIYSVGMVVYEMLTGTVAFHGDSVMNVLLQHIHERPRPPREQRPDLDIPVLVERTVLTALEKDREKRYETLADFSNQLEQAFLQSKPGRTRTIPITPSQFPTVDVTPKPPKPTPTVSPETRSHVRSLWHRAREMARARSSILFIFLLFALVATLAALRLGGAIPFTTRTTLLEYRIGTENEARSGGTPSRLTSVRSGEGISFEFKTAQPGRLCLLYQDDYGFLLWLNPLENGEAQYAQAERWVRVPAVDKKWILIGNKPRTEKFWLIYIPDGLDWSVAKAVSPATISIKSGVAEIASDVATKLTNQIESEGLKLKPSANGKASFELSNTGDSDRVAFYRIELKHDP